VVSGVPLVAGPNVFAARGVDGLGNRSVVSNEVVLISNAPPGPLTGLLATVSDHTVDLAWDAAPEADVFGYRVERDGQALTDTIEERNAVSVTGTFASFSAPQAFDRNPATAWVVAEPDLPASWTVVFSRPVLVERIHLRLSGGGVSSFGVGKGSRPSSHPPVIAVTQA